jgi:hypothetical protein
VGRKEEQGVAWQWVAEGRSGGWRGWRLKKEKGILVSKGIKTVCFYFIMAFLRITFARW